MATLTVQDLTYSGITPTYVAADSGGDEFARGRYTFVIVSNGDSTDHDVTIASQFLDRAGAVAEDVTVTVTAGEDRIIGPFSDTFGDEDGMVQLTYDAVTDVTIGAFKV